MREKWPTFCNNSRAKRRVRRSYDTIVMQECELQGLPLSLQLFHITTSCAQIYCTAPASAAAQLYKMDAQPLSKYLKKTI